MVSVFGVTLFTTSNLNSIMRATTLAFCITTPSALAFSQHASTTSFGRNTELGMISRRESLAGLGLSLGGLLFPDASSAANNPALQTFKGRKGTKGDFFPGKGMRNTEEHENLIAASNPALATFKGSKSTKGAYIPGKGLRDTQDFENLMAANNPALETFNGRKGTKCAFIPGKEYENLIAASNPALATFKGSKATKGAFIPGKGLRMNESFDNLIG